MSMSPVIHQILVASSAVSIAQQANPSTQFSRSLAVRARPVQSSETKTWLTNFEDDHEIVPAKILQSTLEKDKYGCRDSNNVQRTLSIISHRLKLRARSKAPLDVLKNYVPTPMVEGLKSTRFYTKGSDSLVMQSAMGRAQFNKAECLKTFHNLLRDVANKIISEEGSYTPTQPLVQPPGLEYGSIIQSCY